MRDLLTSAHSAAHEEHYENALCDIGGDANVRRDALCWIIDLTLMERKRLIWCVAGEKISC
jgi:hypothetical protein